MALTYKSGTITEEGFKAGLVQNKEFKDIGVSIQLLMYQNTYMLRVWTHDIKLTRSRVAFTPIKKTFAFAKLSEARDAWRLLSKVVNHFDLASRPRSGSTHPKPRETYYYWIGVAISYADGGGTLKGFNEALKSCGGSFAGALSLVSN